MGQADHGIFGAGRGRGLYRAGAAMTTTIDKPRHREYFTPFADWLFGQHLKNAVEEGLVMKRTGRLRTVSRT